MKADMELEMVESGCIVWLRSARAKLYGHEIGLPKGTVGIVLSGTMEEFFNKIPETMTVGVVETVN